MNRKNFLGNSWVTCQNPQSSARVRLFGFPYGGGGASVFRSWISELPDTIELFAIQYPGRENRFGEKLYTVLDPLIQDLERSILPFLTKPTVFLGHSLGALVAFELARVLQEHHDFQLEHLFVSGHRAPHLPFTSPIIHPLPDAEFIEAVRQLNGIPPEAFDYPELLEMITPILRSDFMLWENYQYLERAPLNCPISAFGGKKDPLVTPREIEAWGKQTVNHFSHQIFSGDHFFIHTEQQAFFEVLKKDLQRMIKYSRKGEG